MHPIMGYSKIETVAERASALAPVTFMVPLQGSLAVFLLAYAQANGVKPETVMAEALRAYLGDAA